MATAIPIFRAVSLIPRIAKIATHSPVLYQTAVRGISSLLQSGIVQGYEVGKGRKGLEDAARDIAMTVATSTISVLPENIVRKGFLNMASQVGADLAADIGIDVGRGIDVMSKEWWVNEIPRVGLSLGYGARDWASKGFVPHWNPTGQSLVSLRGAYDIIKGEEFKPGELKVAEEIANGEREPADRREELLAVAYRTARSAANHAAEGRDPDNINNIDPKDLLKMPVPDKPIEDMQEQLRQAVEQGKVSEKSREMILADRQRELTDRMREGQKQKILTGPEDTSARPVDESEPAAKIQKIRSPQQFVNDMKKVGARGEIAASVDALQRLARSVSKEEFVKKLEEGIDDPGKLSPENELYQLHNYIVNELNVSKLDILNREPTLQIPGEVKPDGKRATPAQKNSIADWLLNKTIVYADPPQHKPRGKKIRKASGDKETGQKEWQEPLENLRTDEIPDGLAYGGRIPGTDRRWFIPRDPEVVREMTGSEAIDRRTKQFIDELRNAGFDIDADRAMDIRLQDTAALVSDISLHNARLQMFGPRYGTLTDSELAGGYKALFDPGTRLDGDMVPVIDAIIRYNF